ncbi:efflux RND transporter periplasmic adaptor subunit [Sulfuricurvum sp.]|uniref:efflux RND transporter periplasmic adaptor subunit n=1 Tax=Sulfuricurvum sp. TaxID=2025608 RepID=UPI003BB6D3A3
MKFADKKIIIGLIVLILGAIVLKKMFWVSEVPVPTVEKSTIETNSTVFGTGTLEAEEIVILAPKTTVKIQNLYADEGDMVHAGQLLAVMEPSELSAALHEGEASIAKSRSQLSAAKAALKDLKAKAHLADQTLERYRELLKGGFVTQAEYDSAYASAQSASAQLESGHENIKLLTLDVEKSGAAAAAQRLKIDDLSLRSPFNAKVISKNGEVGSTISAGSAVFRLVNPKTYWVKLYVDERQSRKIKVSQKATVSLRSYPDQTFEAQVARIGSESDRVTEERIVYLTFKQLPSELYLGEQAEASIHIMDSLGDKR